MKTGKVSALIILSAVFLGGIFLSCSARNRLPAPDPRIVSAYTGGLILRTDPIEVVFIEPRDTSVPPPADMFRLKPSARGTLSWKDAYVLVFTPAEPLKPGILYQAIVGGASSGISPFMFEFKTQFPSIELVFEPVYIDEAGNALVAGRVLTERGVGPALIEKTIESADLGRPEWTHEDDNHRFAFKAVERDTAERTVLVNWNGGPIGARDKGFSAIRIPGKSGFRMVELRRNSEFLEVVFSSPVKQYQDLRGFVSLSGDTDIRYSLEGNVLRIYGSQGRGIAPGMELLIQDLEDINGQPLAEMVQYTAPDTWELPELRFTGSGTILPTSQGASMAIETRNLTGLLVEAFQIYGDNMAQFLQVNDLQGEKELYRVGEPVWTKSIDFPWKNSDQNRWIRQGLDLSELSRKYPDGMFRIRLSFRKRHIKYECPADHGDFSNLPFPDETLPAYTGDGEQSYWDYAEDSGYSWYEWNRYRKDPCHPAYYISYGDHTITVGRNVLVSDLGLLAKRTLDGKWLVAASNLKTAQPAANAEIEVLNFQGRVLYRLKTGTNGLTSVDGPASAASPAGSSGGLAGGTPAFITAKTGLGRAFLKLNDSLALTISHFDVSGDRPVEGVRGLLYGERGVWRPGDAIFLTFLLSDPGSTLPADHPVSFELEDPRGRVALQRTYTSSVDGFYPIAVSTAMDAPTGDWTARVRVGGTVFTRNIKVETVMPNRLKMDLDFGPKAYIDGLKTPVTLEAAWLYGAPAPGLKADVSVSFADRETTFPNYGDYTFRDPSRTVSSERQTVFNGLLDDAGKNSFSMELKPGPATPGKLDARFLTRVFEPSGVFSSQQVNREFSPYQRYVGLKLPREDAARNMLLTDQDHTAEILVLDGDGKPLGGNVTLECAIYKLNWRWWWEKGAEERAEFSSALSHTPIQRGTVTASGGRASWNFQVKYPEWGRYLVAVRDSSGGHSAASVVYIDWPGWEDRSQEGGQGSAAMLTLSAEKPSYAPGEKIALSFPSNKEAAALVVVEKGGRILRSEWITCSEVLTRYELTADPGMVPNVYVHVTLLQPHLQTQNDLPLRLYGIIPVAIDDPRTRISPQITAPAVWQPESRVSFSVSEASGRAMTYTVAVVDEGLLGLTRYSLPNPRATFFAREASFLKSWDLYSDIMGAYAGQLETLLAIGGGDDGPLDGSKETQRFKPVVRFFGPYELKPGETRPETFDLPPYIGALRIMVLAASSSKEAPPPGARSARAYGTAEKPVQVSSDLMVFGSIPRLLSPGDEAEIPVSVNSYAPGARTVKVSLAAAGAQVLGGTSQNVEFGKPGEKMVRFRVKAPDLPGSIKISIAAESAGLRTTNHLTDLEIRSTALRVTKSALSLVPAGETWRGNLDFPGRVQTNKVIAEFSRLPLINLEERLEYLIAYPHGCIEQTTSAVFPQLYLDRVLSLDETKTAEIRANIVAGIERLGSFQVPGGGFSYWPGDESPHDWGSTYAGHFLIEAKRAGYAVPPELLKQFLRFQKDRAALWSANSGNPHAQAYRLYTLALAGEADLGSMNRLRERRDLNPQAAWRLAAAYWYAGQRDIARSMARQLDPTVSEYRELSGTFGSALRDKAMILETLILLEDPGRTRPLFEELAQVLSGDGWLSTQETAYALIALVPYMRQGGEGTLTLDLTLAGNSKTVSFSGSVASADLGSVAGTSGTYSVRNRSASPVYVRISVSGLPEEGAEPALSEGLSLTVEYRDMSDRPMDPETLKVGEDMEVRVRVKNSYTQAVSEVALVHPIPASWELINYRLGEGSDNSSSYKYQDIRDDRVMTYFDLSRGEEKTVSFRVNKTYAGSYFRPAIHAYAMYDESIRALIPGVRK